MYLYLSISSLLLLELEMIDDIHMELEMIDISIGLKDDNSMLVRQTYHASQIIITYEVIDRACRCRSGVVTDAAAICL